MYFWFVAVGLWAVLLPMLAARLVMFFALGEPFRTGRALAASAVAVLVGAACAAVGYGIGTLLLRAPPKFYAAMSGAYDVLFSGAMYFGLRPLLAVALLASLAGTYGGWRAARKLARA
jgi:hypothetical protein